MAHWDAVPEVFPDGVGAVYEETGWLAVAHNRWWDPGNVYAVENGGRWAFELDLERGGGVPLEQAFWDHFLGQRAGWGLRVYEQVGARGEHGSRPKPPPPAELGCRVPKATAMMRSLPPSIFKSFFSFVLFRTGSTPSLRKRWP